MTEEGKPKKMETNLVLNVIFLGMAYYRTYGYQVHILEMCRIINSEVRIQMREKLN